MRAVFRHIEMRNLKRDLMLRFTLLLSVFIVLLAVFYAVFLAAAEAKEHDNVMLNIAGRQRMYLYQYASETNQALIGIATSDLEMAIAEKQKADFTAQNFDQVLDVLLEGGEVQANAATFSQGSEAIADVAITGSVIIAKPGKQTMEHLIHVAEAWQELKRLATLSLRSNADAVAKDRYVRRLLDQVTVAVTEVDHVVLLLQAESENKSERLNVLLLSMIFGGLALFLMLVYYVYARIVLPLDHSVRALRLTLDDLKVAKAHAEKASQAKSEFLSSMSHELRTPMNAILGFGQLLELEADNLSQVQRDNVKEILNAGDHLLTLINEVLDLSKIESGKLQVSMEQVQVADLLEQCISLIATQAKARQLDIIDEISCHGFSVKADFTRLKQVILNLLSNAVFYNREHGRILLGCEVTGAQRVVIRVTDTGNGLTPDEIARLFTSFERLDTENNIDGIGIGLVISKHLVEHMGGRIGVESTPGEGATFWIELALADQG